MLEISGLYKAFGLEAGFFAPVGRYVYAVNGVSFTMKPGEIFGLVGESGCGKTTTARLVVRTYPIDDGSVVFTDRDGTVFEVGLLDQKRLKLLRSKVKYIFQDPAKSLNPRMTILEVLTAGYRYQESWPGKRQAREEAAEMLREVGLSPDDLERRPADFSGGQRQRISIARALITQPELLICDEVVSALDVSIQGQILQLLLRLREQYRFGMLFIAHDLAVVSYICDRVGVMYRGMLMEIAPAQRLIEAPTHPYTKHLYAGVPKLEPAAVGGASELSPATAGRRAGARTTRFGEVPDPTVPPPGAGTELMQIAEDHYVSPLFSA